MRCLAVALFLVGCGASYELPTTDAGAVAGAEAAPWATGDAAAKPPPNYGGGANEKTACGSRGCPPLAPHQGVLSPTDPGDEDNAEGAYPCSQDMYQPNCGWSPPQTVPIESK
jgi:hypothetical protein